MSAAGRAEPVARDRGVDVAFVVPPFADVERPSLGPSLLVGALARRGISATVTYPNLAWAERIGLFLYSWFADRGDMAGFTDVTTASSLASEWAFSDLAASPGAALAGDPEAFCARFLASGPAASLVPQILALRELRDAFLDEVVAELRRLGPRIVGFTTTLASTTAGLAIARRLAQAPNPPIIVFGGASCEAGMGAQLLASFDVIDWVCTGEGDVAFPELVEAILAGREPDVPGMLRRGATSSSQPPVELDTLALPEFGDYFEAVARSRLREQLHPRLPFETSRGCWWGQKHHCSFCGLNGAAMSFRAKSPERALAELRQLVETWQIHDVDAVDNIVDHRYFDSFFPRLAAEGPAVRLFYETKANLDRGEIAVLARAGVRAIQPGIESLDTATLRLMRKGSTAAQNICLLRWCEERGIAVSWNILYGFPGEDPDAVRRMAELVPLLHHLPPPTMAVRIRLDRFSPLFVQRAGLTQIRPKEAYRWVFGLPDHELAELAYFFDFDYVDAHDPDADAASLVRAVARWADRGREPATLAAIRAGDVVLVKDTREIAQRPVHVLAGPLAKIFAATDRPRSARSVASELSLPEPDVLALLRDLEDRRLVIAIDGRWLALAVWQGAAPEGVREVPAIPLLRPASHPGCGIVSPTEQ